MPYSTSDLKKGLKVQIDGEPFLIIECNFVKPGKGQAMYKLRLLNLLKGTVFDRTYKSGDSIDTADITEIETQHLYRQGENFVFMDTETFEQVEVPEGNLEDGFKFVKERMNCQMVLWNGNPITVTPPKQVVLAVEYCEPSARGNTATNLQKPCKLETGAEILAPAFVNIGELLEIVEILQPEALGRGFDEAPLLKLLESARQLVEVRWEEIEAVAAALLERETLTGDECWAMIRDQRVAADQDAE